MPNSRFYRVLSLVLAAWLLVLVFPLLAQKEDAKDQKKSEGTRRSMAYPTGDKSTSVILLETDYPQKTRAGEEFKYTINIRNLTDHLVLEDVTIKQRTSGNLDVQEQTKKNKEQGKSNKKSAEKGKNSQDGKEGGRDKEAGSDKAGDSKASADRTKEQAQDRKTIRMRQDWNGTTEWLIPQLQPGESRTITVRAVGHTTGKVDTCIGVKYSPVLCFSTELVKPDLQLTREAPRQIDACETITFKYTIKNNGSAAAKGVVLREDLPEGLKTSDGKKQIEVKIGDLPAGESKTHSVEIAANQSGEYTSRAVATTEMDLRVQSEKTTTKVTMVQLETEVKGPEDGVSNQPLVFAITVTNKGDAPAKETQLTITTNEKSRVVRSTQEGKQADELTWNLKTIKPGESRTVKITALSNGLEQVKVTAIAKSQCAGDKEMASATAKDSAQTKITALPALRLEMFDQEDTVVVGKEAVYEVSVLNQGSGPARDVQVWIKYPSELEFVKVEGKTKEAKNKDGMVSFQTLKQLAAGEQAEWKVHFKAKKSGDIRVRAMLNSRYLSSPIPDVEPTRLLSVKTYERTPEGKKDKANRDEKEKGKEANGKDGKKQDKGETKKDEGN